MCVCWGGGGLKREGRRGAREGGRMYHTLLGLEHALYCTVYLHSEWLTFSTVKRGGGERSGGIRERWKEGHGGGEEREREVV